MKMILKTARALEFYCDACFEIQFWGNAFSREGEEEAYTASGCCSELVMMVLQDGSGRSEQCQVRLLDLYRSGWSWLLVYRMKTGSRFLVEP